jgi:hypothetical protein
MVTCSYISKTRGKKESQELHAMKTYVQGSGGTAQPFLASAIDGGEWLASRLCRFTPGERAKGGHWTGARGGSQGRSRRCGEDKNLLRLLRIEPKYLDRPAYSPSLYRLRYGNKYLLLEIKNGLISENKIILWRVDPEPSNNCVNRRQYNIRC